MPDIDEFLLPEEDDGPGTLYINANAGYGRKHHICRVDAQGVITIPGPLVRELGMQIGDDLLWRFDETDGVLYVELVSNPWKAPEWLEEDEEDV